MSWQRGLFRVYLIPTVLGILVAFYSVKLRHDASRFGELSDKAESTLRNANAAETALQTNMTIRTLVEEALADGRFENDPFRPVEPIYRRGHTPDYSPYEPRNLRARHRRNAVEIERVIGGEALPKQEDELLTNYVTAVASIPRGDSLSYTIASSDTWSKSRRLGILAGTLFIGPWLVHYLLLFIVVPFARWIIAGFLPCQKPIEHDGELTHEDSAQPPASTFKKREPS